jgi:tetratricopeptide (TPR) repeat protein
LENGRGAHADAIDPVSVHRRDDALRARALGAAHTAALDAARGAIATLDTISKNLATAGEGYWTQQVAIQRDAAQAFVLLAEGKRTEAVTAMRAVAAREDATDKSPVTPGPLAPARELLADMLLELKQPADALVEYEAVLKKEPNRFRAIYGAAKAAGASGDRAASLRYFARLTAMCPKADQPGRAEWSRRARQLLANRHLVLGYLVLG